HTGRARLAVEKRFDLDDGWNRMARVSEELHTHRARMFGHAMEDPARRSDHAVATFLLHARQATEELVGDVLAQPGFAELAAFDIDTRSSHHARFRWNVAAVLPDQLELRDLDIVNLAAVVLEASDLQP